MSSPIGVPVLVRCLDYCVMKSASEHEVVCDLTASGPSSLVGVPQAQVKYERVGMG